jgi:glycosyltransferase involved in cell wall biosynthesis
MRQHGVRRMRWCLTQNVVQAQRLEQSFGRESARMVSGHDLPPDDARREEPLVLWVGNPGMNKRPELFVDVARRCAGVRCVMIGDRDHAQRDGLPDLPDNLEHRGRLPFDETLRWFDRAALFVNTSVDEGFPNTFVQAWLRGVPVLTLGVDPDGVIARHGLGEVCADPEALAARVRALLADDEARARLGRNAREYAARHHTVARMADRFLAAVHDASGRLAEATA